MSVRISEDVRNRILRMLGNGMTSRVIARLTGTSHFTVNRIKKENIHYPKDDDGWPFRPFPELTSLGAAYWFVGRTGGHIVAETSRMGHLPSTTVVERDTSGHDSYAWMEPDIKKLQERARLFSQAPGLLTLAIDILEMREIKKLNNHPLVKDLMLQAEGLLKNVSDAYDK